MCVPRHALNSSDADLHRCAEERIIRQNAVLAGIARIFREALTCQTEEELGRVCLAVAEEETQSKFGFVGEINSQTGKLDDIAISDPGWEACRMQDQSGPGKRSPVGFAIHGIYGRVLLDGKGFFTNDPPSYPDSIGTPAGHPPLQAFLGVPLIHAGKTIGMVVLGNRDCGYGPEELEAVEDLAPAIVQAFVSKRAETLGRVGPPEEAEARRGVRHGHRLTDPKAHRQTLQRTDEILSEVQGDGFAYLSDVSSIGFDQRLTQFGQRLSSVLECVVGWISRSVQGTGNARCTDGSGDPSYDDLDALKDARQSVRDHDQSARETRRLERADMAVRLVRWLGEQRVERGQVQFVRSTPSVDTKAAVPTTPIRSRKSRRPVLSGAAVGRTVTGTSCVCSIPGVTGQVGMEYPRE